MTPSDTFLTPVTTNCISVLLSRSSLSNIKPGLGNPKPKFDETFRLARVRFCLPVFWPVFGFGFVCPFLPSLHVLPRFCLKMLVFFIVFALFCPVLPGSFSFAQIRQKLFVFVCRHCFAQFCIRLLKKNITRIVNSCPESWSVVKVLR